VVKVWLLGSWGHFVNLERNARGLADLTLGFGAPGEILAEQGQSPDAFLV
jgi:hypothetical protein